MNKLERIVYDLVKSNPRIKQLVRNTYQFVFDLLPRKKEFSIHPISLKENFFLGFHDTQPFNFDSSLVLANKLHFDLRMPKKGDFIEVGYFKNNDGKLEDFVSLERSFAWNYHKGCRLQWKGDESTQIIFNTADKAGKLVAKAVCIKTQEVSQFAHPIDTISSCGKIATSFSYERLERYMPGYGYPYKDNISFINERSPSKSGLFLIDLDSNKKRLLVSLQELALLTVNEEASDSSYHYVTHSEFSRDSRYISFLHRWVGNETRKRYTKLFVYDLQTEKLISLPTSGLMVSHYVWNSKNQILAYCNFENTDCHALFDIDNLKLSHKVAYPQLNSDGHQSFINDTQFVTDTYPDKWRMAKLYKVDIKANTADLIASLFSPKKYQTNSSLRHIACDLHPRVSRDGRFVCFDTAKTGKRAFAIMKLNN